MRSLSVMLMLSISCMIYSQDPAIRYMSEQDEKKWVNSLPKLTENKLKNILSRKLIPYTRTELPRVAQDLDNEAWDGNYRMDAPKTHAYGSATLDPQWRRTAGVTENTTVVHFMIFPDKGNIDVWRETIQFEGIVGSHTLVRHKFPVGMIFVEAIYNDVNEEVLCTEIRIRKKVSEGHGVLHWTHDRFMPIRESKELDEAIARVTNKPSKLSSLFHKDKYQKRVLDFGYYAHRFDPENSRFLGYEINIPTMDQKLVSDILKTTTFKSTTGHDWEVFSDGACAAPTTNEKGQLYPPGYNGAFFSTNTKTCTKCHADDMRPAGSLGSGDWYGFPNGDDSVRSWTPLQPIYGGVPVYNPPIDSRIVNSPRVNVK